MIKVRLFDVIWNTAWACCSLALAVYDVANENWFGMVISLLMLGFFITFLVLSYKQVQRGYDLALRFARKEGAITEQAIARIEALK